MDTQLKIDKYGDVSEVPVGYWRRGQNQYWHIKEDSALLINLSEEGKHYDGDGHYIFFKWPDSVIRHHAGRVPITREEFEKVKGTLVKRILNFK